MAGPGVSGGFRLWMAGSRNTQTESVSDSEYRRLREGREQREAAATSDDDLESHISVADTYLPELDEMDSETSSSDPIDVDATISEGEEEEHTLARNGYDDSVSDYLDLFKRLKLRKDFYEKFRSYIKEHREEDDVKAVLMKGTEQSVKEVAGEFLEIYGNNVWKLKGKNCQQDRNLYGQDLFDIKIDSDRLIPILDELWFRVRDLLYTDARPAAERITPSPPPPPAAAETRRLKPKWPDRLTSPDPVHVRQTAKDEDDAVTFLNKVRTEVHNFPGLVKPRPREELWKH